MGDPARVLEDALTRTTDDRARIAEAQVPGREPRAVTSARRSREITAHGEK